ncbi:MAG: SirB2 family protein, partial [Mariprofundaceae bacterium]|nr:SirB2 family protein [Mariprofundaceae bacterium]
MSAYSTVKIIHASCALLTLLLFIWRGRLAIEGRGISRRWLRLVPDSVDTVLLGTGVALVLI